MKAETGKAGYKLLAGILKSNRDKAAANTIISTTPQNDNVRGASAFKKGQGTDCPLTLLSALL